MSLPGNKIRNFSFSYFVSFPSLKIDILNSRNSEFSYIFDNVECSFNEILLGVSARVWNVDDRHASAAGKCWAKCEVDIEFAQWQGEKNYQTCFTRWFYSNWRPPSTEQLERYWRHLIKFQVCKIAQPISLSLRRSQMDWRFECFSCAFWAFSRSRWVCKSSLKFLWIVCNFVVAFVSKLNMKLSQSLHNKEEKTVWCALRCATQLAYLRIFCERRNFKAK